MATECCAVGERVAAAWARWRQRTQEKATRRNGTVKRSGPRAGAAGPPAGGRGRRHGPAAWEKSDRGDLRVASRAVCGRRCPGPGGRCPEGPHRAGRRRAGWGAPAQASSPTAKLGGAWLRSRRAGASRRGQQRYMLLKTQDTGGWTPSTGVRKTPVTPRRGALRGAGLATTGGAGRGGGPGAAGKDHPWLARR